MSRDSILPRELSPAADNARHRVIVTIYLLTDWSRRDHKGPVQRETGQCAQGEQAFLPG